MLRRLVIGSAVLLAAAVPASAANAADLPADVGVIDINITSGLPTSGTPTCNPDVTSIGMSLLGGASSVAADCTVKNTSTGTAMAGTVAASTLATAVSDTGFNNGTFSASCDINQSVTVSMTISKSSPKMNSLKGTTFQNCSFSAGFNDASKSAISGTMEINGSIGSDAAALAGNEITVNISADVFVTNGTGTFAGYGGSGTFTRKQTVTIPSIPSSGGGSGGGTADFSPVCSAFGISPCTLAKVKEVCASNPPQGMASVCTQVSAMSVSAQSVMRGIVKAMATGNSSMKLNLVKGGGAARILSPAAPLGQKTGVAKVKSTTKVKVAAAPGSVCTVTNNKKKVVGKATIGASGIALVKAGNNAYKSASSIVAKCVKDGKTLTSNSVKVKLG